MARKHEATLRQLNERATDYARFCFNEHERRRWLASVGKQGGTAYAVLVVNRFVPLDAMPAATPVIRRWGRGMNVDAADLLTLRQYWAALDAAAERLHQSLVAGDASPAVRASAVASPTWPAVGIGDTEEALRSLLMLQFERIRQARISWATADGSTCPTPTRDGMCLIIDWARRA
jgi:hypothetical protein